MKRKHRPLTATRWGPVHMSLRCHSFRMERVALIEAQRAQRWMEGCVGGGSRIHTYVRVVEMVIFFFSLQVPISNSYSREGAEAENVWSGKEGKAETSMQDCRMQINMIPRVPLRDLKIPLLGRQGR